MDQKENRATRRSMRPETFALVTAAELKISGDVRLAILRGSWNTARAKIKIRDRWNQAKTEANARESKAKSVKNTPT